MNRVEAKQRLFEEQDSLKHGYAHDLMVSIAGPSSGLRIVGKNEATATEQDCDSLFRALILDEHYSLDEATELYDAAMTLVGE